VQLPVADVDRRYAGGARLQERVREAASRGTHVGAVAPGDVDPERVQRRLQLVAAARHEPRRPRDFQANVIVDRLAGLVEAGDEPREDERLRLAAALREPLLDEECVEALLHAATLEVSESGNAGTFQVMPTWLLILIIVLVLLLVFGGWGYGRR
jgi:hypothetical protein